MSDDKRIDASIPHRHIVIKIAEIIRDYGPIQYNSIFDHLPKTTGLTSSYISYILKKLKSFGVVECVKKGHPKFVWVYVQEGVVPAKDIVKSDGTKVMLKNMGSYRVRTTDGRSYERMEFHRRDLTWSNKRVTLDMGEIEELAYIPDHATYKSGSAHLDIYAHKFVGIGDWIVPKMKASDEDLPKWVNPIRAKSLGMPVYQYAVKPKPQPKKDYGSPHR